MIMNLPANAGVARDKGLIPGSGISPGVGNGNPLQCSCPENPLDGGAWQATVHRVTVHSSPTQLSNFTFNFTSLSVDGWSCVPSLLFTWGHTMVEVMRIKLTPFQRSQACTATLSAPNPTAGHCQPTPPLQIPGHSQASLGQSLVGLLLLSPVSYCSRFYLCPPRVSFSVLCKFWQLYGEFSRRY